MPCPKLACPCHGLACHVKIVRAMSERVMIDPCQCRSVSMSIRVSTCQIQGWPFRRKKAPAASWIAATGLVKSRGDHFRRKKSACGKLVISNRACQIQGWSFSPRKQSACGKLDSSNRACQVGSVPCQVGSVSCRVKSGPCQPPSVSCRVKPHPCQSCLLYTSPSPRDS